MISVLFLFASFAAVFTISKVALSCTAPFFLVGSRMLLGGTLLLGYQAFFRKETVRLSKENWIKIAILSLFAIYLTNICEFWGLQYLSSAKTCFIYSSTPFVSAFLAYLLLSEKMTVRKWFGLVIGFLALFPIFLTKDNTQADISQFLFFSTPELAISAAVLFSTYGWILLKQLVSGGECSPFLANGWSMCIGGALALTHSLFVENWSPLPVTNTLLYLECVLALIVVSNLLSYNLYGALLKKYSTTFLAFAGLTTPLFASLYGSFFLHETIPLSLYASLIPLSFGLFLFHQEELRSSPAPVKT